MPRRRRRSRRTSASKQPQPQLPRPATCGLVTPLSPVLLEGTAVLCDTRRVATVWHGHCVPPLFCYREKPAFPSRPCDLVTGHAATWAAAKTKDWLRPDTNAAAPPGVRRQATKMLTKELKREPTEAEITGRMVTLGKHHSAVRSRKGA